MSNGQDAIARAKEWLEIGSVALYRGDGQACFSEMAFRDVLLGFAALERGIYQLEPYRQLAAHGARPKPEADPFDDEGEWQVYEVDAYATAVIQARWHVVARSPEEARRRFLASQYDDYHLPDSVEDWLSGPNFELALDGVELAPWNVESMDEARETIGAVTPEEVLAQIAELEEDA